MGVENLAPLVRVVVCASGWMVRVLLGVGRGRRFDLCVRRGDGGDRVR